MLKFWDRSKRIHGNSRGTEITNPTTNVRQPLMKNDNEDNLKIKITCIYWKAHDARHIPLCNILPIFWIARPV